MSRHLLHPTLAALALALALGALPARAEDRATLKLATTTSTENTGLLDVLLSAFTAKTKIRVQVIAVGTGKALKLGENGDVDLVMVHAREAEESFVARGFGVERHPLMKNDFLIVGPAADPSGVKGAGSLDEALRRLKRCKAPFVSRGDNSGTHMRELKLWKLVDRRPDGPGCYFEIGQGQEAMLRMAHEKQGYALTDRGTYISVREKLPLVPVYERDPQLDNPYSLIAVNPKRHRHVRHAEATKLISWLTSAEGQRRIGAFRVEGEVLFHPTAVQK